MDELIEKQEPGQEEIALPAEAPEGATDATEVEAAGPEAVQNEPDVPPANSLQSAGDGQEAVSPEPGSINPTDVEELVVEELVWEAEEPAAAADSGLHALIEAIIYVTEEPVTPQQIAAALDRPVDEVRMALDAISAEFEKPQHGMVVREIAGGYKMATKPEHHEAVRAFVKSLKPPLKLSLAALETLAVVAYKQPITAPEIMEIRGVQGAGVLKTLLDRKLIMAAGRKQVIGKPVLYRTTREFLVQFGLKDVAELPTLKDFEEIRRMSIPDSEPAPETPPPEAAPPQPSEPIESTASEAPAES